MTIQQLLLYTIENHASDLHLLADSPPMVRLDGSLVAVSGAENLSEITCDQLISQVMSPEIKQMFMVNKEADFSFKLEDGGRFRVNTYFQKSTPAASFRLIPNLIPNMETLGLPPITRQIVNMKQGFVLVTGPTGHGKSTTLASIIEEINKNRPAHIITVEDPVEYVYSSSKAIVSQREMKTDTHSWDMALRSILREDPDVVLIGEMRDFETISQALTIAETGHLVLATLHTNSASQTVDRIIDVFPENQQAQARIQLSASLEVVISQRLIPKTAGGRTAAFEVMIATPAIKTAIRESRSHTIDNIILTSSEYGMMTLETSLSELVRKNLISEEIALDYAMRPADLSRFLKRY
jgi:twitching motility protein PilT